ncbi:hypothetical protein MTR_1g053380 [Medicago truncatula]|uniref:Retrotransposon gag domain-containing protein n=1 Tax=Medicago truncatula TaxID=3880 RepID=A0A072VU63_MEDTR|nr:hypothetical protein MTR_1g053380 [Medicago truncatula]
MASVLFPELAIASRSAREASWPKCSIPLFDDYSDYMFEIFMLGKRGVTIGIRAGRISEMAGRNDAALAAALQAVGQQPNANAGVNAETRMRETFIRNHPPTFKGRYDPDGAQTWLKEIERIFRVMQCTEVQKVRFGTHQLAKEADDWWVSLRPNLEQDGAAQGNMSVTEYAAMFVEFAKFYPHYAAETAEFSKCFKFENGLRPDIKRAIGYQQIQVFPELVNNCRIYEEDTKAHYKVVNERKTKGQQSRPKPYSAPTDKGKQRMVNDRRRMLLRRLSISIVVRKATRAMFVQRRKRVTLVLSASNLRGRRLLVGFLLWLVQRQRMRIA